VNFSKTYYDFARFCIFLFDCIKIQKYGVNRPLPSLRATLDIRVN